jgi:hypothetical protein
VVVVLSSTSLPIAQGGTGVVVVVDVYVVVVDVFVVVNFLLRCVGVWR